MFHEIFKWRDQNLIIFWWNSFIKLFQISNGNSMVAELKYALMKYSNWKTYMFLYFYSHVYLCWGTRLFNEFIPSYTSFLWVINSSKIISIDSKNLIILNQNTVFHLNMETESKLDSLSITNGRNRKKFFFCSVSEKQKFLFF